MSEGTSWTERVFGGLRKTSERLGENLSGIVSKTRLDDAQLDEIEDALILSDLGPRVAARIRERLAEERFERGADEQAIKEAVAEEIAKILRPVAKPIDIVAFPRPQVILVIGVNGSGKTTTIAKLAHYFQELDYGVMLAAGDTFRAAAIGQLKVWADRVGVPIVTGPEGGDPASIVFDAVKSATDQGIDALIVDTAGRLQNKRELMDELAKIRRVLGRLNPEAPHDVVLVLDATNGQNALQQIEIFKEVAGVTGLIMTKLDGTARGGVLVAAAEQYCLPIHAIGVGEKIDDLRPFDPDLVARVKSVDGLRVEAVRDAVADHSQDDLPGGQRGCRPRHPHGTQDGQRGPLGRGADPGQLGAGVGRLDRFTGLDCLDQQAVAAAVGTAMTSANHRGSQR